MMSVTLQGSETHRYRSGNSHILVQSDQDIPWRTGDVSYTVGYCLCEGKAVAQHANGGEGGRRGIAPTRH
jgi:hypothetical protein